MPSAQPFVRSVEEQLHESQQLQDSQRKEIQTLWKQLADNELARAADLDQLQVLRKEIADMKAAGLGGTSDSVRMARLKQRCLEAEHTARMTEKNFKASLEVKENESSVARKELQKVAGQLSAIMVLLGGRS